MKNNSILADVTAILGKTQDNFAIIGVPDSIKQDALDTLDYMMDDEMLPSWQRPPKAYFYGYVSARDEAKKCTIVTIAKRQPIQESDVMRFLDDNGRKYDEMCKSLTR